MNKFEYKIVKYDLVRDGISYIQDRMSELGNSGWELCSVVPDGCYLKCFFKRVIQERVQDTGPR